MWVGSFWDCLARPGPAYRGNLCEAFALRVSGRGVGLVVVGGLFVEMCIVDASIFVVKLSRADGGCLGTRSR